MLPRERGLITDLKEHELNNYNQVNEVITFVNDDLQGFKTKLNKAKTAKSQQNITELEWLDIKSRIKRILNNITLIKAQGVEVAENKRPVL